MAMFIKLLRAKNMMGKGDEQDCVITYSAGGKWDKVTNATNAIVKKHVYNDSTNIGTVTFYSPVVRINEEAGSTAYNLTMCVLPPSVTTLCDGAFSSTRLTYIDIPSSVVEIGVGVFKYTNFLEYVNFSAHTQIPTMTGLSSELNDFGPSSKIIVPDDLYEEWIESEHWKSYATRIIRKTDYDSLIVTE